MSSKTIEETLKSAISSLTSKKIENPSLDAEILLTHILNVPRSYLYARPEEVLPTEKLQQFFDLIQRRENGEPVAYLVGHKEFWSLNLNVSPSVLIPRPETELLVELTLKKMTNSHAHIADLGTGSGAIGIALAYEQKTWSIHVTDKSSSALEIARLNAKKFNVTNMHFHLGNWCEPLENLKNGDKNLKFDAIVSNPPYIAPNNPFLVSLSHEPQNALIAEEEGYEDLITIILTARHYLKPRGLLLLEHGAGQAKKIANFFQETGYTGIELYQDLAGLDRVTIASWPDFEIDYTC